MPKKEKQGLGEQLCRRSIRTVKYALLTGLTIVFCPVLLSLALMLLIVLFVAFAACGFGYIIYKLFE